jgi:formylmethanofuran dehydrogenase subunit A
MENRLIDDDLIDSITTTEMATPLNFPGITAYVQDIQSIITTAELLSDAITQVLDGETTSITAISPSELLVFNTTCRTLCANLGQLESTSGIIPIHIIRIVRELQVTAMVIANSPELFADDKIITLNDMWG